jgi:hypothetical protein
MSSADRRISDVTNRMMMLVGLAVLMGACGADPGELPGEGGQASIGDDVESPVVAPVAPAAPVAPVAPAAMLAFASSVNGEEYTPALQAGIDGTPEIYVVADWTGVAPEDSQRLALYAPNGTLYYSTAIPFTQPERSDVSVQVLADGTRRVIFTLQIWGTTIEMYRRVGTWRAEVGLDGGAVAASSTVVLE